MMTRPTSFWGFVQEWNDLNPHLTIPERLGTARAKSRAGHIRSVLKQHDGQGLYLNDLPKKKTITWPFTGEVTEVSVGNALFRHLIA